MGTNGERGVAGIEALVERALGGDRGALARVITIVESRGAATAHVMQRLYPRSGRAHVIGITGPPGAGKSTLVNALIGAHRARGLRVGVVAVDPSSPFSGGSVLGDRIRMQPHFLDPAVFIRSLSTRGSHGGLPRAARDVVRVLDACGMDVVLVETVGVGQTELAVMGVAETVVVVLVPEAGDAVQVMKAGLLEIADVFVVNKADRDGAERMRGELVTMLGLRPPTPWTVPVVATVASRGDGVPEVVDALDRHRAAQVAAPERAARDADRRERELSDIVEEELERRVHQALRTGANGANALVDSVRSGAMDPYAAAAALLADDVLLRRLARDG